MHFKTRHLIGEQFVRKKNETVLLKFYKNKQTNKQTKQTNYKNKNKTKTKQKQNKTKKQQQQQQKVISTSSFSAVLNPPSHITTEERSCSRSSCFFLFCFVFQSDTLFSSKLNQEVFETTDLGGICVELVKTDSIQEKFEKLNVEGELQLSVLSGLVEGRGSGAYLGEERKSARNQSMSLIYRLKTVHEELMVRQNKEHIDLDVLRHWQTSNATQCQGTSFQQMTLFL